jgi:hypothetical protein
MNLKQGGELVAKYIDEGKISPEIRKWINMEALSSEYGWTPNEIRKMKAEDASIYSLILTGKNNSGHTPKKFEKKLR